MYIALVLSLKTLINSFSGSVSVLSKGGSCMVQKQDTMKRNYIHKVSG